MSTYIEYPLEDGTTILVETAEPEGIVKASRPEERVPSKINFKQAFAQVQSSIKELLAEFNQLQVDEAEIKFGLKSTGEAGVFAIGKVGGEMNFEVTLKWKQPEKSTTQATQ